MCFVLHADGSQIQLVAIDAVMMRVGRPTATKAPIVQSQTSSLLVNKLRVFTSGLLSQIVEAGLPHRWPQVASKVLTVTADSAVIDIDGSSYCA
jgi:hypothetical protein